MKTKQNTGKKIYIVSYSFFSMKFHEISLIQQPKDGKIIRRDLKRLKWINK